MMQSLQRLGDDPRDYDGSFKGLDDNVADVMGARCDADYSMNRPTASPFKPWKIYPKPPTPHWHWTGTEKVMSSHENKADGEVDKEFDFDACEIPGGHPFEFGIDDRGVFQVYENANGGLIVHIQSALL